MSDRDLFILTAVYVVPHLMLLWLHLTTWGDVHRTAKPAATLPVAKVVRR